MPVMMPRSPDGANGSGPKVAGPNDRLRAIRERWCRLNCPPRITLRSIRATKFMRNPRNFREFLDYADDRDHHDCRRRLGRRLRPCAESPRRAHLPPGLRPGRLLPIRLHRRRRSHTERRPWQRLTVRRIGEAIFVLSPTVIASEAKQSRTSDLLVCERAETAHTVRFSQ